MFRHRLSLFAAILVLMILSLGCSSDSGEKAKSEEPAQSTSRGPVKLNVDFEWGFLPGQFVMFYYQPVDSIRERAPALLKKAEQMYSDVTYALQNYDVDTLYFFCFADLKDLLKDTGLNYTTIQGDSIFYGYGPVFGRQITEFVMGKIGQPHYLFMQEGLPTLYDYSNRNFHDLTYSYVQQGNFDGIKALVDNDSYKELDPAKRQIEAASFCGFMLTQWGTLSYRQKSMFRRVYDSQVSFASAAQQYFEFSMEDLEKQYLNFLPTQTDKALRESAAGDSTK